MTDSQRKTNEDIADVEKWFDRTLQESGDARRGTRRLARARLRRAGTPLEIMQEPAALCLIAKLTRKHAHVHADRVAVLAGVLAFVEEKDERTIARAIGRSSLDDDDAVVSEIRFRRLLQTPGDDLLDPMRRLVRLTGGKANIRDMSFSVLRWGDRIRKRWIFDYYGVSAGPVGRETAQGAPAPSAT